MLKRPPRIVSRLVRLIILQGYTGYINSERNLLIPIKGHSTHVGKRASAEASRLEAANVTSDAMLATMHTMHHPPHPSSAYVVPNGTGGGYWIKDASRGASGPDARPAPSKPFVARSSYHHEVCAPRVRAGVVPRARPVPSSAPPPSSAAAPRARLDDVTRYDRDFGVEGSNPLKRAPSSANARGIGAGLTQRSTTAELNLGTSRVTRHLPGYAGFVPATAGNPTALDHSDGVTAKPSPKDAMLMKALDQYHRGATPGQTLWRPQHPRNVVFPPNPPTERTTTGEANARPFAGGPAKPPERARGKDDGGPGPGVMSFFTAGVETVSDNGKTNAQQFYAHVRPFEGQTSAFHPSRTTARGSRFVE